MSTSRCLRSARRHNAGPAILWFEFGREGFLDSPRSSVGPGRRCAEAQCLIGPILQNGINTKNTLESLHYRTHTSVPQILAPDSSLPQYGRHLDSLNSTRHDACKV